MKILYDHQIFLSQKFGGISRYFIELMSRLPNDITFDNSILFTENIYLKGASDKFSKGFGFQLPKMRGRGRIYNIVEKLHSSVALKMGNFDVFHPTYYNPYFLQRIKRPYVITVHDMIHEKFPELFKNDATSAYKRKTIMNADKLIAISQSTKNDMMEIYGLPDEKIEVVHLGHSVDITESEPVENLPKNYILFVGQRGGYKNFDRFLKAFAIVNKKHKDVKLVCTGTDFKVEEYELIHSLNLDNEIFRYFVTDKQLTYLYQHAICFVYPSLYEGFGIPILEAFASECPLALSDTSCFPEIARDGGEYFNPYEIDSIADSILKIVESEDLRLDLIKRGNEVLSNYSWDKMANETAEIYRSLI